MTNDAPDPRMAAAVALLGRTGAADIQIRYSDDEHPTIWFTVARYRTNPVPADSPWHPGQTVRIVVGQHAAGQHPRLIHAPVTDPLQTHRPGVCPTCSDPYTGPGRCAVCRATGVTA